KENFLPVDGGEVLKKILGFNLTSWNFIGHDPKKHRHYGPMAQDFFGAFGKDAKGEIGTPTTINSGDIAGVLMGAAKELAAENVRLRSDAAAMKRQVSELEARLARLERAAPAREPAQVAGR